MINMQNSNILHKKLDYLTAPVMKLRHIDSGLGQNKNKQKTPHEFSL